MDKKLQETKDYFASPRLNATKLKGLDSPKLLKWREDNPETESEDKRYFRVGSAIDCLLTTPALFNDEFVVMYERRPTGLMGVFIDALPLDLTEESEEDLYQVAYEKSGYKRNIGTVIHHLWAIEKNREYYMMRKSSGKKRIISLDELEEVQLAKKNVLDNPYAIKYFINTNKDEELIKQLVIYWEYEEFECKAMLDSVLINHKEKYIQPVDLKSTASKVYQFKRNVMTFKYYLQAAFYDMALRWKMENEDWYSDYELRPFKFIASEKKGPVANPAIIFSMTKADMKKSKFGGTLSYGGKPRKIKGVVQLIDDYRWHIKNDYWSMPKDLVDKQGEYDLNLFSDDVNFNDL